MKKGSKLYSIVKMKCPHCHEGSFFEGSAFKGTVKEKCDSCGEYYSMEPGFYQGSYYVVYALGVAVFVTTWSGLTLFAKGLSFNAVVFTIIGALCLLSPLMYPLSKIIWANMFFNFKGNNKKNAA